MCLALKEAGYRAVAVENGERAMPLVHELKPDFILLDMLMPVMDGMKFLQWLKDKARVSIPTLVLTCLDQRGVAVDALVAGATEVMTKPFQLEILLKKLESLSQ